MNFPANGVTVLIDPIVCVCLFTYLNLLSLDKKPGRFKDSRRNRHIYSKLILSPLFVCQDVIWLNHMELRCFIVSTLVSIVAVLIYITTIVNQCSFFLPGSSIAFIVRHWAFFSLLVGHWCFFGDHLFSLTPYLFTWVFTLWLILGVLYIL